MKNFLKFGSSGVITFLSAAVAAVLVFLIGNEANSFIASAITGGVLSAIALSTSFPLGKAKESGFYTKDNSDQTIVMLITGVLGAVIGGLMMLL